MPHSQEQVVQNCTFGVQHFAIGSLPWSNTLRYHLLKVNSTFDCSNYIFKMIYLKWTSDAFFSFIPSSLLHSCPGRVDSLKTTKRLDSRNIKRFWFNLIKSWKNRKMAFWTQLQADFAYPLCLCIFNGPVRWKNFVSAFFETRLNSLQPC